MKRMYRIMRKTARFSILALMLMARLFVSGIAPASADGTVQIGYGYQAGTLMDAMRIAEQYYSGEVTIMIMNDISQNEQIEIPDSGRIQSVKLVSYAENAPVRVDMNGLVICANGVSFTLGVNVSLANSYLVGGRCVSGTGKVYVENSQIYVHGHADVLIGGGLAIGNGAYSETRNATVRIYAGSANQVYGGGYAMEGGTTVVSQKALCRVENRGVVYGDLYVGGFAEGYGSASYVNEQEYGNNGSVKTEHSGGASFNGGVAYMGQLPQPIMPPQPIIIPPPVFPTATSAPRFDPPIWKIPVDPIIRSGFNTILTVGAGGQYRTLGEAVSAIPYQAGNTLIQIIGDVQQSGAVMVPENRGVSSLTVDAGTNEIVRVIFQEGQSFFANGIPFTLGRNVIFSNCAIYGGGFATNGDTVSRGQSNLIIYGGAERIYGGGMALGLGSKSYVDNANTQLYGWTDGWIYGGGNAENGGSDYISGTATLYIDANAVVGKSLSAGGKAKKSASFSKVNNTSTTINGRVKEWVYNGGSALNNAYASVSGSALMTINSGAIVEQSVAGGGFSFGTDAVSIVNNVNISVSGTVYYAFYGGGYANEGGRSDSEGLVTMRLEPNGVINQAVRYGGRAFKNGSTTVNAVTGTILGRCAKVYYEGRASDNGVSIVRSIR